MKFGLRGRLVIWVSIVLAFSGLGLMSFLGFGAARALKTQAVEEMRRTVGKTAEELELWLDSRARDAVNWSEMEVLAAACKGERRPEAEQALNRFHRRSSFYENVFLADANGKIFLDSIGGKSTGVELSSLDDYRVNVEHARQRQLWIGDARKSPATGRPVSLITTPILAGEDLVGILGTPIELAGFLDARTRRRGFRP